MQTCLTPTASTDLMAVDTLSLIQYSSYPAQALKPGYLGDSYLTASAVGIEIFITNALRNNKLFMVHDNESSVHSVPDMTLLLNKTHTSPVSQLVLQTGL